MDRLRQPGDSDYDVLGVSPGATDEEIDSAFYRLINEQGYRVGVPLERQWARAREIRVAHATLGDPVKRRAYDESLSRASDPALWARTANDAATDKLVLPEIEPEAAEPVENKSTREAVVPRDPDGCALTGSEPEQAPDRALGPDAEEVVWFHNRPPPPYLAPTPNDNKRASAPTLNDNKRPSVRTWGMATAVAFGLGLVLLLSWPEWNRQPTSERTPRVTAHAPQASGAGPGLGHYSAQAPGNFNGAAASDPEEQGASPSDSQATSDGLGRPLDLQRASDERTAQDVAELATRDTADAQSHADRTPTGKTPAAAGASSAPKEAAEARAKAPAPTPPVARAPAIATAPPRARIAPAPTPPVARAPAIATAPPRARIAPAPTPPVARAPAIATAPPRARIAPAITGAPVRAGSSRRLARSPPQWVGGGPTDADNRQGRYQGTVAVQVTIAPGGRVSNCVPVRGSGNAGLDAMTCRLVQERARFTPALDAQGRPVVSQAYTTFVWGRRRRK